MEEQSKGEVVSVHWNLRFFYVRCVKRSYINTQLEYNGLRKGTESPGIPQRDNGSLYGDMEPYLALAEGTCLSRKSSRDFLDRQEGGDIQVIVCKMLRDYQGIRCEWRSCGGQGMSEAGGDWVARTFKVML